MSSYRLGNLLGIVTVSDISISHMRFPCFSFCSVAEGIVPGMVFFFFCFTVKLCKILFDWCAADSLQCTSSNSGSVFLSESSEMPWGKWNRMLKSSSPASACSVGWSPSLLFELPWCFAKLLTGWLSQAQACAYICVNAWNPCWSHRGPSKHPCEPELWRWM